MRTVCPITKRKFDCSTCEAIKDDEKCPYMICDEMVEQTLKFLRKMVENETGRRGVS